MGNIKIWIIAPNLFQMFKQSDFTFIKIFGIWIRYKTKDKDWWKSKRIKIRLWNRR